MSWWRKASQLLLQSYSERCYPADTAYRVWDHHASRRRAPTREGGLLQSPGHSSLASDAASDAVILGRKGGDRIPASSVSSVAPW